MSANIYPRVTIAFCTQCKWLLRAAYFGQELLSTFSTSLGEVSLQPSTGGTFVVTIQNDKDSEPKVLWDRKVDGGFPETKVLKQKVRDVVDPGRGLGHVDGKKEAVKAGESKVEEQGNGEMDGKKENVLLVGEKASACEVGEKCEDCQ
ncbi:Rdx family-domain-containing protein [Pyronema omphalodes]|nr:Rdx family-domain-containing protein [Pyronema omphalodes]